MASVPRATQLLMKGKIMAAKNRNSRLNRHRKKPFSSNQHPDTRNTVPMKVARISIPLFQLGQCIGTCGAKDVLDESDVSPYELLCRHQAGDWGILEPEDWEANIKAVEHGLRVFSSYRVGADQTKVWVITEADRSATTILLPEEY